MNRRENTYSRDTDEPQGCQEHFLRLKEVRDLNDFDGEVMETGSIHSFKSKYDRAQETKREFRIG